MISGSTPTNTFTLPFDPYEGTKYRIVYAQGENRKEKILFEKTTEDCTVNGRVVSVRLTQEETLLFDCTPHYLYGKCEPYPVKIQIGVESPGGDVLWSNIIETPPERCLKRDGVV